MLKKERRTALPPFLEALVRYCSLIRSMIQHNGSLSTYGTHHYCSFRRNIASVSCSCSFRAMHGNTATIRSQLGGVSAWTKGRRVLCSRRDRIRRIAWRETAALRATVECNRQSRSTTMHRFSPEPDPEVVSGRQRGYGADPQRGLWSKAPGEGFGGGEAKP